MHGHRSPEGTDDIRPAEIQGRSWNSMEAWDGEFWTNLVLISRDKEDLAP